MAELLAPAGNPEKLRWAIRYGADAVYFGIKQFSLRSFAGNFSLEEAEEAFKLLHKEGRQGYVTLNIYPFSEEYDELIKSAHVLEEIGADALIVSDLGVLNEIKKAGVKTPLHISTQANTVSSRTALAYRDLGAKRVNLARELSFDRIKRIQEEIKGEGIETEVFIHGAVCFSYSGRCAISDYMTGRRANRGECTHPCRWNYKVMEEKRPGEYLPVFEDDRGLYLFNPKELALFPFMRDLAELGVDSFKLEGRMKSIHYLASVLSLYRRILDGEEISFERAMELLGRVKNRGYGFGFMKGDVTPEDYGWDTDTSESTSLFLGNVLEKDEEGKVIVEVRNKILAGETVELLLPGGKITSLELPSELELKGKGFREFANHGDYVKLDMDLDPYTILRRVEI